MGNASLRNREPRVTIGLPVYNGEAYLAGAIESVLAQSFEDLELVISDNASSDATAEICRDFAARDPRLRYFRNDRNWGAAPNYNRAFALARGRYFKWLSHDDVLCATYLERTLEALERRPDAVICNTRVEYIDAVGTPIGFYDSAIDAGAEASASERFSLLILSSHSCVDFFGLARKSAMENSLLHGSFHGADRAFLAQMTLRGRIIQLPEYLVRMREHHDRYTRTRLRPKDRLAWHDSSASARFHLPTWHLYRAYIGIVRNAELPPRERWRCRGALIQWWLRNWNALRLFFDTVALISPGAVGWAESVKNRWFGVAPGHFLEEIRGNDT